MLIQAYRCADGDALVEALQGDSDLNRLTVAPNAS